MFTTYGTNYSVSAPSETYMLAQSRICQPGARGIVICHGRQGVPLDLVGLGTGSNWQPVTKVLQNLRCPIIHPELADNNWGNDAGQARVTDAQGFIQSAYNAKSGKVILIAGSMGGLTSLNWARANPTQVAALALLYPCVNLQAQHDGTGGADGAFASDIETAYGGASGYAAALAAHDPAQHAASYTNAFPIRVYNWPSDNEVGSLNVTNFVSAVGGSQISLVSLDSTFHGDMSVIPMSDLNSWLSAYL